MASKTPSYWYEKTPSSMAKALLPLSVLFHFGGKLRAMRGSPSKANAPVICVGNLTAGGAGKTPVSKAILKLIGKDNGFNSPHFITRGYGRNSRDAIHLSPDMLSDVDYVEVGDEVLLLLKDAPVSIGVDRYAAARSAIGRGADLLIMDDGLQNPSLHKDVKLCVVDGTAGFGNRMVIPSGPLRTALQDGLEECDAVIVVGDDNYGVEKLVGSVCPVFKGRFEPVSPMPDKSSKYLAFAGLGLPDKFRRTLTDLGYDLVGFESFADHYPYTETDIQGLQARAQAEDASLITTEKDAIRIRDAWDIPVEVLKIELVWDDPDAVKKFLLDRLKDVHVEDTEIQI